LQYSQSSSTRDFICDLLQYRKNGKEAEKLTEPFELYLHAEGVFESAFAFYHLCDLLITGNDTLNSKRIDLKHLPPLLDASVPSFIDRFNSLCPLLQASPASEAAFEEEHRDYLKLLRAAFELYEDVLGEYTGNKAAYSLLDFDDLIWGFRKLLEDPRIRAELAAQFRYIMIDEYQDTDENQFELAQHLTERFSSRNNLTIVGDPKQSIYTFRNADATIFRQTREVIAAQDLTTLALEESAELQLSPEEERGSISLRESFRMTSGPLAIVNKLFGSVMHSELSSEFGIEEVEYASLVQGRTSPIAGSVEWISPLVSRVVNNSEETTEENETDEADETQLIALKIWQIVNDTSGRYSVEDNGTIRRALHKDIAILLRSRTHLPALEQALRTADIPYTVAKGAGFYGQQEILDISSYLNFLVNPANDVALAAVLRSPFFALSEVDLYQIAHHQSKHRRALDDPWSFWDQFQSYTELNKRPQLVRAVHQLREGLTLAGRTGAALLIEKIYAQTGIFATLATESNGIQKVVNLEKFLAQARDSDASGFSSLFDFVDRVQYLIDENENESQADIPNDSGAVRIMTVHSAKGLEFPIVIVPFLQKKFHFDHTRLLDKEHGLQIKYSDADRKPLIAELIRLRAKHTTIAEEKRIFYVALTRARDHLILSSTISNTSNKESWLAWLLDVLPAAKDPSVASIELEERIERYDSGSQQISEAVIPISIPLIRVASDIPVEEQNTTVTEPLEVGPIHLMPLPVLLPHGRYSATQFLTLRQCPTKYHLAYALGMPEEPKLASYDFEADRNSETVQGKLLGQIVHKLFDKIDSISSDGTLDTERFQRELSNIFFSLDLLDERERARYELAARKHVLHFLQSDFSREVLSSSDSRKEYALQARLKSGDILYGIIDCLYRDTNNIWTVLDYKTDAATDPKRMELKNARYEFQIGFYAYLVHLLFPEEKRINAALFYTEREQLVRYTFESDRFANMEMECERMIEIIRRNENVNDLTLLERNLDHCAECAFFDTNRKQCIALASMNRSGPLFLKADRQTSEISELA
jgi:ATP-dependent helicase/nuclease subunit A